MEQQTHIKKIKPQKPKPNTNPKAGPGGGDTSGGGCIPVR